jgi:hypothetical protein
MIADARSVAALVMALVFGASAAAKVRHPLKFAAGVASYGLLPQRASVPAATLLIAAESALALCHVAGQLMPAAAYMALGLLCGFFALTLAALRAGHSRPCFCFDTSGREQTTPRSLARLALLAAGELVVLAGPAGELVTVADLWYASRFTALINVMVLTTVAVVGGRWIVRFGDIGAACRARQPLLWTTGRAESQFHDWSTAADIS